MGIIGNRVKGQVQEQATPPVSHGHPRKHHENGVPEGDNHNSSGVGGAGGVYYDSSLSVRERQMQFACKYPTPPPSLPPSPPLCLSHVEQVAHPLSLHHSRGKDWRAADWRDRTDWIPQLSGGG